MSQLFSGGDWYAQCFRCGSQELASEMRKQWQGFYVCTACWEPRHPQDFVKAVPDNPAPPWAQPFDWHYAGPTAALCTIPGKSAIPGFMMPGCSIPHNTVTDYFS